MTQPGWYPEPGNPRVLRYWDGIQWTPQVQPVGSGAPNASPGRGVGVVGLLITTLGVAAIVVAFAAVDWFNISAASLGYDSDARAKLSLSDLASDDTINGFSNAYFSWLCWLLLVVAGGIAVAAAAASTHRYTLRFVGLLVGIVGAGLTMIALATLAHQGHIPFGTFIGFWSTGPWLAMIGFATIGVGSMCGEIST